MSTDSGPDGAGGSSTETTSEPVRPDLDDGPDAAEAAGFGGITWADEVSDEPSDPEKTVGVEAPDEDTSFGQGAIDTAPDEEAESNNDEQTIDSEGSDRSPHETSVEGLVQDLERVTMERDQYLDTSRRLQAEFENYRKAVAKRETESRERANESLVAEILPVLDACDSALASGSTEVEPVRSALIEVLTKRGLDRIDGQDEPFDPVRHDAVMHEPDEDGDGPIVAEVMRAGYSWKGRVVRPAMVRVRG